MTALLVLYMVNQLLLPGHVDNIAGFPAFRSVMESLFGQQSPQALASHIFGLYSGFVYFTPMLGGLIADRWIGQRNAVVTGALLMSGGHLAMVFEQSFLLALLLLITGSGFLKGNISAQVGSLYSRDDEAIALRSACASVWLALRLRSCGAIHVGGSGDLFIRLSPFAGKSG
jgi:POT family proton-dependent oligopeptide transporter